MNLFESLQLQSNSTRQVIKNKNHIFNIYYLLFFIFLYITVDGISRIDSMDLGRYIEYAIQSSQIPWMKIIENRFSERGDFLYYIIISTSAKLSIPLTFVTTVIVFTYYLLVIKCIRLLHIDKIKMYVLLCVILTTPIVWVVSISRNLTAIMFLYCAFYFFYKRKNYLSVFFMLIGVLTHFTTIIWVVVFAGCCFLHKRHVKTKIMFILLSLFFILGHFMPLQIQEWIMLFFEGKDLRYSTYNLNEAVGIFSSENIITIGDRLSPIFALAYSCILLLCNRKQGFSYWYLFILTILLAYFLNSSITFVNRIMMFIPLLWGVNLAVVYSENNIYKQIVNITSFIGILFIALNIYTHRTIYI